jgi:hypothetical protein
MDRPFPVIAAFASGIGSMLARAYIEKKDSVRKMTDEKTNFSEQYR